MYAPYGKVNARTCNNAPTRLVVCASRSVRKGVHMVSLVGVYLVSERPMF